MCEDDQVYAAGRTLRTTILDKISQPEFYRNASNKKRERMTNNYSDILTNTSAVILSKNIWTFTHLRLIQSERKYNKFTT